MACIKIINKKGSKACRTIREKTGIYMYKGKTKWKVDALINYGVCGNKLDKFYRSFPSARKIPTINKNIGISKYSVIKMAEKEGIVVPITKISLTNKDNPELFIEKKTKSIGGIGIRRARGRRQMTGRYYQEFIDDRDYELRVHAFEWMKDFEIQKRLGPDKMIAWNYHNGGHFIIIRNPNYYLFDRAKEISRQILLMLGMGFGAVDFVVDKSKNLYFIEINSAPGFQELSEPIYVEAFTKLKEMPISRLRKLKSLT
jgi:hypothetical protein